MGLANLNEVLKRAVSNHYAVGAFNVANMEMIMGVIQAAEKRNSPVILQIAQVRLPYSPLELIGPMMLAAAKQASVPVSVHFDHGLDYETIHTALDLGFTSVMIDASSLPIRQNIEIVKKVKQLADSYGASVEAEAGQLAGSEGGDEEYQMFYSDPVEVKALYEETGVDAIAVSIGNAHGLYQNAPKLNFGVLEAAAEQVPIPLVLHGGTGISDRDFRTCIQKGIHKINIATANFHATEQAAREYAKQGTREYFQLSRLMSEAVCETVKEHLEVFGSVDKAER